MRICRTCSTTFPDQVGFCPKDGSPLAELQEWAAGATIRGKYRILSMVGQGGMASVYKALHLGFHELRALKVLNRELAADARFVKRFKQEAFTTRKLQHPNVVRVEDIDETEEGQPFIVMEFIEGKNLHRLIEKHGAMKVGVACSIAKQIASALVFAHGLGVIHRDLKPDNIVLLAPAKGLGTTAAPMVKVLDFGIAQLKEVRAEGNSRSSTLTQPGFILGTPDYMSPEQAMGKRGDDLDARSDIYSLGIVMYQMLTGELPFRTTSTMEMLVAHLHEPPRPIRDIRPDLEIPRSVADIVMQCLEKTREARPQTAQALIQALETAEAISTQAALDQGSSSQLLDRGLDSVQLRQEDTVEAKEQLTGTAGKPEAKELDAAREHEADLAQERETARAQECGTQAQKQKVALAEEDKQILAATDDLAGPKATIMIAKADLREVLPTVPATAKEKRPPSQENPTAVAGPSFPLEKSSRHASRTVILAIASVAVVLIVAFGFVLSKRHPAVPQPVVTTTAQPQPSIPSVTTSPTPVQDQATAEPNVVENTKPALGSTKPTAAATPSPVTISQASLQPLSKDEILDWLRGKLPSQRIVAQARERGIDFQVSYEIESELRRAGATEELVTILRELAPPPSSLKPGIVTLQGHTGDVVSAVFSPDGQRILTASRDRTARVWSASSGQLLATLAGHTDVVWSAAFSGDGHHIVTGSWDNTARVWSATNWQPLATLKGHTGPVKSAAFSPDGQRVVTASEDKTARVWNISGRQLAILQGHTGPVSSAVFSPDGRHIVTASIDKTARVWNAANGQPLATLQGHTGPVSSAVFSPDGKRIVTASGDKTARVWDAANGQLLTTLEGHSKQVESAMFSRDGQHIVTASYDHTARVWDAGGGAITLKGHSEEVYSAVYSPDDRRVVTASHDGTARVWDAANGELLAVTPKGHMRSVHSAVYSPDGQRIVTASEDNTARVWAEASLETGTSKK